MPQVTVIPNGIDVDRFANAKPMPQAQVPWPLASPVIGYLGRFDPVKNLPVLIEAFATLPAMRVPPWQLANLGLSATDSEAPSDQIQIQGDLSRKIPNKNQISLNTTLPHLALIGAAADGKDAHTLTTLRNLCDEQNLRHRVSVVGASATPESWLKCLSVLVLPSEIEGFGLVLAEALAVGIPVVAVSTTVTSKIVADRSFGRLVLKASSSLVSVAIKEVMEMSFDSQKAREHIALNYGRAAMSTNFDRFFKNFSQTRS